MTTMTKLQLETLRNARDNGCPWRKACGGMVEGSWTTGYRMMLERLEAQGMLYAGKITQAGRDQLEALDAKREARRKAQEARQVAAFMNHQLYRH